MKSSASPFFIFTDNMQVFFFETTLAEKTDEVRNQL